MDFHVNSIMINKTSNLKNRSDYILMTLLVVFSGNPIATYTFLGKFAIFTISSIILVVYWKQIRSDFYARFLMMASALILLYLCQLTTLYYVSWLAGFRYIMTILFGGLVYYILADRFSFKFFIVIYYVSLISLVMFVIINLLHINIPGIPYAFQIVVYGIYTYLGDAGHSIRNAGMFWEPGAFAGILTLCIGLNMKELPFLWKTHKIKIYVIIIALLTTQSTTGYIIFFITAIYYFAFFTKSNGLKYLIIPVLLVTSIIVYKNADFLQEKIEHQSNISLNLAKDEFSNSRFGSFIFDLHYINKHPLIGNGFSEITRYADHPYLIGTHLGNGNGFSNYMACLGIPFVFFYFLISFNSLYKIDSRLAFIVCLIIFLTLFGEQWLNFPLFVGMMFINNKRKYIS